MSGIRHVGYHHTVRYLKTRRRWLARGRQYVEDGLGDHVDAPQRDQPISVAVPTPAGPARRRLQPPEGRHLRSRENIRRRAGQLGVGELEVVEAGLAGLGKNRVVDVGDGPAHRLLEHLARVLDLGKLGHHSVFPGADHLTPGRRRRAGSLSTPSCLTAASPPGAWEG